MIKAKQQKLKVQTSPELLHQLRLRDNVPALPPAVTT
jgi:hypothetical protein